MTFDYLSLFAYGLMPLPVWGYIVVTLTLTQVTIAAVTIYLHRGQAHRTLELHPVVSYFFRFWLWLTTGMLTKEWVAIPRGTRAVGPRDCDNEGNTRLDSSFARFR